MRQSRTMICLLFPLLMYAAKPLPAQESETTQEDTVRKLQTKMDELKKQMAELQAELDAINGAKVPTTGSIASVPPPPPNLPQPTPEQQEKAAGKATSEHQTFNQDEQDAP